MSSTATLPEGVTRRNVPLVGDIVTVSNPEILRRLADHPDIARPDQGRLPPLMKWLLYATQFFAPDHAGGEYAVAFTTTDFNDQAERRQRVFHNLANGFTDEQVAELAAVVRSDIPKPEAAKIVTRLVGPTVIGLPSGQQIPDDVINCMDDMDLNYILNPIRYLKARAARAKVQQWARDQFPDEKHVVDIAHDLLTLYHGFTVGLVDLRDMEGTDLAAHLGRNPILPASLRIPLVTTTVDGLFPEDEPLVKDGTVIIMDNGSAAKATLDPSFVFGMGIEKRQCPFRHLFFSTGEKIIAEEAEPDARGVRVESVTRMGS